MNTAHSNIKRNVIFVMMEEAVLLLGKKTLILMVMEATYYLTQF